MVKRRPLVAGMSDPPKADPKREEAFVYGPDAPAPRTTKHPVPEAEPVEARAEVAATRPNGRSPLTTRIRSDLAAALKRASLQRQLASQTPNTVQDILEEALEPWLQKHGYLP